MSFYTTPDDPITKVFRIQELDGGDFNFMYAGLQNESELVGQMEIRIKKGQFIVIQKLIEYALPSMFGWNVIYDPKAVNY